MFAAVTGTHTDDPPSDRPSSARWLMALAIALAPWLFAVAGLEVFLDFADEQASRVGGRTLRAVVPGDLHRIALRSVWFASASCLLLAAVAAWRRRSGTRAGAGATLAAASGLYAAVMLHRVTLLDAGMPSAEIIRAAFPVRLALLSIGAALILAATLLGNRGRRRKATPGDRLLGLLATLISAGCLYSLLGHATLFSSWFAYEPPFCGRDIEPISLPPAARRVAPRHGVWRDGGYDPHPPPSPAPWTFVLAPDRPRGVRTPPVPDRPPENNWLTSIPTAVPVVIDRRVGASEPCSLLEGLSRREECEGSVVVHAPIEGSLRCDEMTRLTRFLPWVAPLAMHQGRVELAFVPSLPERGGLYYFTRLGDDAIELRDPDRQRALHTTTSLEELRSLVPDVTWFVLEFDEETPVETLTNRSVALRREGFQPSFMPVASGRPNGGRTARSTDEAQWPPP